MNAQPRPKVALIFGALVLGMLLAPLATAIWGKLGDLYGRKRSFEAAIFIFLIGSVLSGMSQNMLELIGFRALQGPGGGGLIVTAQAIVGDVVGPRERGKLLGGFFVDHLSWH